MIGGKNGGGNVLTEQGKEWLERYDEYRNACVRANRKLFDEYFPEQK